MRVRLLVLGLAGCGFSAAPRNEPLDGAIEVDAADAPIAIDATPVDGAPERICLGTFVRVCVDPPQAALILIAQQIDTSQSAMCVAYTATPEIDACVITGMQITIPEGNTVSVVGNRPLILVSTRGITIDGTLDAASRGGASPQTGAAANTGPCTGSQNAMPNRAGGGFGGSFGSVGGDGGNSAASPAGMGGRAPREIVAAAGTRLTGGCAGGAGADNPFGSGSGSGGASGGAVLLLADQTLSIDGVVNASGRGGSGGGAALVLGGGAGGGGSGGMIVLEAAIVDVPGACFANGGGGGEGGEASPGNRGGEPPGPDQPGLGGTRGNMAGGTGGAGAFGEEPAAKGINGFGGIPSNGGGGGAGGGAGIIRVIADEQHDTDDRGHVDPQPR